METELQLGQSYRIFEYESKQRDYSFEANFIGKEPEGNIFATINNKNRIMFYRNPFTQEGKERKGGFPVEEIERNLSETQREFLVTKINGWNELKRREKYGVLSLHIKC